MPNPQQQDPNGHHSEMVDLARNIVSNIHPPGSFDLDVVTQGDVTVVFVNNNKTYLAERAAVATEFNTIQNLIKVCEQKPEIGSTVSISISDRTFQLKLDSMESLLGIVQLGIDTVRKSYTLTEDEQQHPLEQRPVNMHQLQRIG